MSGYENKVTGKHDYDPRLPKSALVYHVREPHLHGDGRRLEQVVEKPQEIRRWSIDELRVCHAELHGGPGIP